MAEKTIKKTLECDICNEEFEKEFFCSSCSGLQEDPYFKPHFFEVEVGCEVYIDEPDYVHLDVCGNCCDCWLRGQF